MIQWLDLIVFLTIVAASIGWALRNRTRYLYAVPPILNGLHGAAFYIALWLRDGFGATFVSGDLTAWSSALRLHSALTVLIMVLAVYAGTIRIVVQVGDSGLEYSSSNGLRRV